MCDEADGNPFGEVHMSTWFAARIEGLSEHHVRRLCRSGAYPGAFRRAGSGAWMIPVSAVTRTMNGALRIALDPQQPGYSNGHLNIVHSPHGP